MHNRFIFRCPMQIASVPGLTMPGARPGCLVKLFSNLDFRNTDAWAGKQTRNVHFSFHD